MVQNLQEAVVAQFKNFFNELLIVLECARSCCEAMGCFTLLFRRLLCSHLQISNEILMVLDFPKIIRKPAIVSKQSSSHLQIFQPNIKGCGIISRLLLNNLDIFPMTYFISIKKCL